MVTCLGFLCFMFDEMLLSILRFSLLLEIFSFSFTSSTGLLLKKFKTCLCRECNLTWVIFLF